MITEAPAGDKARKTTLLGLMRENALNLQFGLSALVGTAIGVQSHAGFADTARSEVAGEKQAALAQLYNNAHLHNGRVARQTVRDMGDSIRFVAPRLHTTYLPLSEARRSVAAIYDGKARDAARDNALRLGIGVALTLGLGAFGGHCRRQLRSPA